MNGLYNKGFVYKAVNQQIDKQSERNRIQFNKMTMYLGQSSVVPQQPFQQSVSITKKISNYIFRFDDKIGQGNFSKVYKGYHQLTNEQVAIKIVELSSVKSAKMQELLFSEIQVIQSLNHPNILKCHQVLKSENNCYIITELCNGGDLQSLLKQQKSLTQQSAAPYIKDIFQGLLYLCQRGIVHRDLKIANIFLHNNQCKIADFGFAKYTNNQNFHDLDIGSPLYMSPEGMIDHMYGMKTDVWAFGIILYELLHGKTPFSFCTSEYELKRAVATSLGYHSFRQDLSEGMKQLILKCLIVNFEQRPDAIALKSDSYIQILLNNTNEVKLFYQPIENNTIQQISPTHMIQQHNHHQASSQSSNRIMAQNMYSIQTKPQQVYQAQQQMIHSPYQQNGPSSPLLPYHQVQPPIQQIPQQQPIQQLQYPYNSQPLQFNSNSPNRAINLNNLNNIPKQLSLKGSKKKQRQLYNQLSVKNMGDLSPSTCHPRSYENIQITNNSSFVDLIRENHNNFYPTEHDHVILNHDENNGSKKNIDLTNSKQRNLRSNRQNNDYEKMSNSSWSPQKHQNANRKKFPKTLSFQNINKPQNNLVMVNQTIKNQQIINNSPNQNNRANSSFQTHNNPQIIHNNSNQKLQHSNSITDKQMGQHSKSFYNNTNNLSLNNLSLFNPKQQTHNKPNLNTSVSSNNNRNISSRQNVNTSISSMNNQGNMILSSNPRPQLTFKQEPMTTSGKKFGQLIKGEKKTDGPIKSTIKVDKTMTNNIGSTNNQTDTKTAQRTKTKSHTKYEESPGNGISTQSPQQRRRQPRYSYGDMNTLNGFQAYDQIPLRQGQVLTFTPNIKDLTNNRDKQLQSSQKRIDLQENLSIKTTSQSFKTQIVKKQIPKLELKQPSQQKIPQPQASKAYTQYTRPQQSKPSSQAYEAKLPSFIYQKQMQLKTQRQQLHRNLICTIIEFKQAVGLLHYCRLYYRFITTLKKVMMFSQVNKLEALARVFKKSNQIVQIYSRFLITGLNELIENIKCKQILYDGENYKKKKLKEDKLKQVTDQYFKKYITELNRNKSGSHKVIPNHTEKTCIQFVKDYNEKLWEELDQQFNAVMMNKMKQTVVSENFIKQFRNLCYFGLRIQQANQIIINCIHLKNYKSLSDTLIENWLAQEYYGQDIYFKIKNDYFRRMNEANALKNSQTNDTDDNRTIEPLQNSKIITQKY